MSVSSSIDSIPAGTPVETARRATPTTSYVICTNPRSGSWLISEGLSSTKVAGNPREWFHHSEEARERARIKEQISREPNYQEYVDWMLKVGSTPNGIFGIKLHYYQFAEITKKMSEVESMRGLPTAELMSAIFPNVKYVWLTRRDRTRQALSYYRASKTDQWWQINANSKAAPPTLDLEGVAKKEKELVGNDTQWQDYFNSNHIDPYVIYYEDLAADYDGTIRTLLGWLGVPNPEAVHIPPTRLQKQSDDLTEEWLAAYLRYKSGEAPSQAQGKGSQEAAPPAEKARVEAARPDSPPAQHQLEGKVPDGWKAWIGTNRLRGMSDAVMIEVMERQGFNRNVAAAEILRSAQDPYFLLAQQIQKRLDKTVDVMTTLDSVQALNPHARTVQRRPSLTTTEFFEDYYSQNRPVIMTEIMADWPAMTLWNGDYFKEKLGDEVIEVMTDRNSDPLFERNSGKHRSKMVFRDYVDLVYNGVSTNDYYMVANNAFFRNGGAGQLMSDIVQFPAYLTDKSNDGVFFWFGPAGTITPLHHDTSNIFMAQIAGRKHIKMAPPNQWRSLYNTVGVFSDVDPEDPDYKRWPELRNATFIDVILEPGEVLFVPVGWWHHVRALDPSIMISFTNFARRNHFKWDAVGAGLR
jgi:LPS sulfotransferase NodH